MNRRERRAAKSNTASPKAPVRDLSDKCKMVFHVPPEDYSHKHLGMFMVACSYVWSVAIGKVPGEVTYPIHIAIEMNGKKLCGHIEPSAEGDPGGAIPGVIHTCPSTQ